MYQFLTLLDEGTTVEKLSVLEKVLNSFLSDALFFLKGLIIAIIILMIGKKLIKLIIHILGKYFVRSKLDYSVTRFLTAFIRAILYIILLVLAVRFIGVDTSSIVALVGSVGLTLGLALQGSLSNFAGGVLILILKPFRTGDYIIIGSNEGTVTSIDIFYTKLVTFDNRLLIMPNGVLSNTNIVNVTNEPRRRLDINLPINYSENIKKVRDILLSIVQNNEMVLQDYDITVVVNSFDPSSINIGLRVWVATENYWPLKWGLLEQIKSQFDENEITIQLNQLDVNLKK